MTCKGIENAETLARHTLRYTPDNAGAGNWLLALFVACCVVAGALLLL